MGSSSLVICRLCMLNGGTSMELIFQTTTSRGIANKIASVTQLRLFEGDGLPEKVCQQCIFQLDIADNFIQRCISSDAALRSSHLESIEPHVSNTLQLGKEDFMEIKETSETNEDHTKEIAVNIEDIIKAEDIEDITKTEPSLGEFPEPQCSLAAYINDGFEEDRSPTALQVDGLTDDYINELKEEMQENSPCNSNAADVDREEPIEPTCSETQLANGEQFTIAHVSTGLLPEHGIQVENIPDNSQQLKLSKKLPTKFICKHCNCEFDSDDNLEIHHSLHMEERSIRKRSLRSTLVNPPPSISRNVKIVCTDCNDEFDSVTALGIHRQNHKIAKRYSSAHCNIEFGAKSKLKNHIATHTTEKRRKFSCSICSKSFATNNLLNLHKLKHPARRLKTRELSRPRRPAKGRLTCETCGKTFATKGTLASHMRRHDPTRERPFACQTCGATFLNKISFVDHAPSHDAVRERRFPCTICAKRYMSEKDMKSHMRRVHCDSKLFTCKPCGKSFHAPERLKQHLLVHPGERLNSNSNSNMLVHKKIHTGKLNFECNVCKRSFNHKSNLVRHIKSHEGLKAHECEICGKAFIRVGTLKSHWLTHSDNRPFSCSICHRAFKARPRLTAHVRTHTLPFKCQKCEKTCKDQETLDRHISREHIGRGPFKCEVCQMAFIEKKNLIKHLQRYHMGMRTLHCKLCNATLVSEQTLELHMTRKHKNANALKSGHTKGIKGN